MDLQPFATRGEGGVGFATTTIIFYEVKSLQSFLSNLLGQQIFGPVELKDSQTLKIGSNYQYLHEFLEKYLHSNLAINK